MEMFVFLWQIAILSLKKATEELNGSMKCFIIMKSFTKSCPMFLKDCKSKFFHIDLISEKARTLHSFTNVDLLEVDDDVTILSWLALSYIRV